jgi:hypothetical protein
VKQNECKLYFLWFEISLPRGWSLPMPDTVINAPTMKQAATRLNRAVSYALSLYFSFSLLLSFKFFPCFYLFQCFYIWFFITPLSIYVCLSVCLSICLSLSPSPSLFVCLSLISYKDVSSQGCCHPLTRGVIYSESKFTVGLNL